MRPQRLVLILFSIVTFPIIFTFLSISITRRSQLSSTTNDGGKSTFKSLFFFESPSSLFPPSAIISLTDDNNTFFVARPAAYGPTLHSKGISGELWAGSEFNGDEIGGITVGELGCSDIPGWSDGAKPSAHGTTPKQGSKLAQSENEPSVDGKDKRYAGKHIVGKPVIKSNPAPKVSIPTGTDGTDDHLTGSGQHHPAINTHADIQSLQETAEITGKIVLLRRGGCGFLDKTKWVQKRGGIALIVGDDIRRGGLVTMYARGDTSNITIPSVFTSHTTAQLLSSLIPDMQAGLTAAGTKLKGKASGSSKGKPVDTLDGTEYYKTTFASFDADKATTEAADPKRLAYKQKRGWISSVFGSDAGSKKGDDSRRPPSSGKIGQPHSNQVTEETNGKQVLPDDFLIGVQDWRDPDLVTKPTSNSKADSKSNSKDGPSSGKGKSGSGSTSGSNSGSAATESGKDKSGRITPGSGEYRYGTASESGKSNGYQGDDELSSNKGKETENPGGFLSYLPWVNSDQSESQSINSKSPSQTPPAISDSRLLQGETDQEPRKGLWVTLTPTTLSSSPFFDTLLVLVVSPLVTLTIVYTILLVRSRIRRRRWRAPKSLVDRLPVRIYHTLSNSSSSSPRLASSNSSSPTAPLLQPYDHSSARQRSRSPALPETNEESSSVTRPPRPELVLVDVEQGREKPQSRSRRRPRRRYVSSQIECVVCLEEYVDGVSRVMRLPCGHEFHAACM
jgi:hypothetical protein